MSEKKNLRFEVYVTLKEGFQPIPYMETETDFSFIIEARNRATADRMVKAMLSGCNNVEFWDSICID